jgi:hypothetical protein
MDISRPYSNITIPEKEKPLFHACKGIIEKGQHITEYY